MPLSLVVALGLAAAAPRLAAAIGVNAGWACVARSAAVAATPDTCRERFMLVLKVFPSTREAHDGLAVLGLKQDDFPAVLHHVPLGTGGAVAHLSKGLALHALGREAEAIPVWRTVNAQRYFFWQARAREEVGATEDAIALYQRVLLIDPRADDPFWEQGPSYRFLGFLTRAYISEGRFDEAARTATVWSERPTPPGEAFFLLGLSRLKQGRFEESMEPLREAIGRDARNWAYEAGWWLGQAFEGLGDWDAAVNAYREVDKVAPAARTANSLGAIWMRKGERVRAIEEFQRAIKLDPDHHPSYLPLAIVLRDAGNLEAARSVLVEALSRWPADAALRNEMNTLHVR